MTVETNVLAARSKEELLRRNAVFEAFFEAEAPRLAEACHEMSRRFLAGGRLLAFGNGSAATDAEHVSVEFVHPVIVGKRALPALDLGPDFERLLTPTEEGVEKRGVADVVALLAVLEKHVDRLPQHVVEDLENLLGHERVPVRRRERVLPRLPRQREGQRPPLPSRPERPFHRLVRPRKREAHHHVLWPQHDRQAPLEVRAKVERRQRPLAHDYRMHELNRDVLGVRGGRPVPERQQPPAGQEASGHLVAGLGQARRLGLEEGLEDRVTPQKFTTAPGEARVGTGPHTCV